LSHDEQPLGICCPELILLPDKVFGQYRRLFEQRDEPLSPASRRCAMAIRDAVQAVGIEVRVGLHTGECEVRGDDIWRDRRAGSTIGDSAPSARRKGAMNEKYLYDGKVVTEDELYAIVEPEAAQEPPGTWAGRRVRLQRLADRKPARRQHHARRGRPVGATPCGTPDYLIGATRSPRQNHDG
jgi:class 3 adenylate cyclase